MQTNNTLLSNPEQWAHDLEEFTTIFLELLFSAIADEMKAHNIRSLPDYVSLLLLQYYTEKQQDKESYAASRPSSFASNLSKRTKTKSHGYCQSKV